MIEEAVTNSGLVYQNLVRTLPGTIAGAFRAGSRLGARRRARNQARRTRVAGSSRSVATAASCSPCRARRCMMAAEMRRAVPDGRLEQRRLPRQPPTGLRPVPRRRIRSRVATPSARDPRGTGLLGARRGLPRPRRAGRAPRRAVRRVESGLSVSTRVVPRSSTSTSARTDGGAPAAWLSSPGAA